EGESQVPGGRGALGVEETIKERIHLVPRYRQRIHRVPLNLVHPVWVDDPHFDLGAHVRREVLAPPGDGATLRKLVMRILARALAGPGGVAHAAAAMDGAGQVRPQDGHAATRPLLQPDDRTPAHG